MKSLIKKALNHAFHLSKHVSKHKHHYALGTFGSFAVVKMIVLFAGFFGLINLASTFAAPSATNVAITTDSIYVGDIITGSYTFVDNQWEVLGSSGFSNAAVYDVPLYVYEGTPYVVFADGANSSMATVMKYSGTSWTSLGSRGFSVGWIDDPDIFVDNGTPYISFVDGGNSSKLSVMKFNGTGWEYLGATGCSEATVGETTLFVDNGVPYVGYRDNAYSDKATVMKYDSGTNSWDVLGITGFSSGTITSPSLYVYNGVPYLAYGDTSRSFRAGLMQYDSGSDSWQSVGSPFSAGMAGSLSLAMDSGGTPYVAYSDSVYGNQLTVKKYTGTGWFTVGPLGFTEAAANYPSLSIYNDVPYVVYRDNNQGGNATLRKFNTGTISWDTLGSAGFTQSTAAYTSLFVYNGVPYVAYQDGGVSSYATVMRFNLPDLEGTSLYQWYRDGAAITGANTITYTNTLNDIGSEITFGVTPVSLSGVVGNQVVSAGITIIAPRATDVIIDGTPSIGNSLTGSYSYKNSASDPEGTSLYQWYRDGGAISGANTRSYTLSSADAASVITFEVTPISTNGVTGDSVLSAGVDVLLPTATGISITGTHSIDATLTGLYTFSYSDVSDPEGASLYQWYRDGAAITGATGLSYLVTEDDLGATITFGITPISTNGIIGDPVVSAGADIPTGPVASNVSITGTLDFGETLTASYTYTFGGRSNVGNAGFSSSMIWYSSLAVDKNNGTLYLAYQDKANSNKATVMQFDNGSWRTLGDAGFSSSDATNISLAIGTDGIPYVAFSDKSNGDKITVMKLAGTGLLADPTWTLVGSAGFSAGIASYISLAIADNGTPYVAYRDDGTAKKAIVKRFDGSAWQSVGTTVSDLDASYTSLAINHNNVPYVAYADKNRDFAVTVRNRSQANNRWESVGNDGFTASDSMNLSLTIDSNNIPYVAYSDKSSSYGTTVMKWSTANSRFEYLGSAGITDGTSTYNSLAVDSNNVPYLACQESSLKASLLTFSGSSWRYVGGARFSPGKAYYVSLALSGSTPYVGYQDNANGDKATVMTFSEDIEGTSLYKWYRNGALITGADDMTYVLTGGDAGKTFMFSITPISQLGVRGATVQSNVLTTPDADEDGIFDAQDNCPLVYNPGQEDSDLVTPETVEFTKIPRSDFTLPENQDCITENVCITRGNTKGIYNAAVESSYNNTTNTAPADTEWSYGSCADMNSLTFDTWYNMSSGNPPDMVGIPACLHLITDDKYYDITFTNWNQGPDGVIPSSGGGFSYERTEYLPSATSVGDACDCNDAICTVGNDVNGDPICAGSDGYAFSFSLRDNEIQNPWGMGVDHSGYIYLADEDTYEVQKFDSDGNLVTRRGTQGSDSGQFMSPEGLGIDAHNNIYVTDDSNTIQKFDSDGNLLAKRGSFCQIDTNSDNIPDQECPGGTFYYPYGAAIDNNDNVYVIDSSNTRVQKFDSDGNFITMRGEYGTGDGQFMYPYNLAVDRDGNVYVPDAGNHNVQKFDSDGNFITSRGSNGSANGEFNGPSDIAIDSNGNVFVVDERNYRVQQFDSNGTFISTRGSQGADDGKFSDPYAIAVDDSNNVYVLDLGKISVEKFTPPAEGGDPMCPVCGNGVLNNGETCDDGLSNSDTVSGACNTTCNGTTVISEVETPVVTPSVGGGVGISQDQCPADRDCSSSYYDNICGPCSSTGTTHASASCDVSNSPYSTELTQAFSYAYDIGITTQCPISKANINGQLQRNHFAKMITEFAIKVLGKKPDTKLSCAFADTANESAEMKFYIKTACQLGLMGRNSDGKTTQKTFNTTDTVTRAQFGTVLSRLLYGTAYNSTDKVNWYGKHLQALNKVAIMNNISTPTMKEIRGYVMLMFQRTDEKVKSSSTHTSASFLPNLGGVTW